MEQARQTVAVVQNHEDRSWIGFSPTSRFSFVSEGSPDAPEFFEEHSQRGDGPPMHRHPWPTWEIVVAGVRAGPDRWSGPRRASR